MKKHVIKIKDGRIRFIYDDKLRGLMDHGKATVHRASHVEPIVTNGIKWQADLSPVKGPILGPFNGRQEALDREVEWLRDNNIPIAR